MASSSSATTSEDQGQGQGQGQNPQPQSLQETSNTIDNDTHTKNDTNDNTSSDDHYMNLATHDDPFLSTLSLSTLSIHADTLLNKQHHNDLSTGTGDIAPPIHLSTTYNQTNQSSYIYSRVDNPLRRRLDNVLGVLDYGYAISYSSGLSAVHSLLYLLQPKCILLIAGYFGVTENFIKYKEHHSNTVIYKSLEEYYNHCKNHSNDSNQLDLIWLESPNNPYCTIEDLEIYTSIVKKQSQQYPNAKQPIICVDATLSSPIGQLPLKDYNIDIVMHSATKYLGGHSDLLAGVLVVHPRHHNTIYKQLLHDRYVQGNAMGNLECYLLLRSLRTLEIRVKKQSENAIELIEFLKTYPKVTKIHHPYIATHVSHSIASKYLLNGIYPSTFSIVLQTQEQAELLPTRLKLVSNATSLGGYESLIESRYRYDKTIDPALLRLSVGLENATDLINDYKQALDSV